MAIQFDELNSLKEYFAPMKISDTDKERRIALAELVMDVMLFFFSAFVVFREKGGDKYDRDYFVDMVYKKLEDSTLKVVGIDEYISNQLKTLSEQVVDTTMIRTPFANYSSFISSQAESHQPPQNGGSPTLLEEDENENSEVSYWLSEKRAFLIAGDTANNIMNYSDYLDAVEEGKQYKQWLTMKDEKVRVDHWNLDNKIIGIDDLFVVGISAMRFPKDTEYGASPDEIINCRCSVRYF